ncbi:MAG: NAD(P)(+) transhydrogenase (Re/Si-specific) subunit beta [Deltaproteobacteria bacterium]|nr:NAD(P)(+) transhydrogenase (Re/Si-specific) subunit beta [Deltaproteobacteria bacterium]
MSREILINFAYLVAAVLFILGLKGLAHPRTAIRGNLIGAIGMLIAIVATLLDQRVIDFPMILLGMAIGTVVGAIFAVKVAMTAMPQMVALLNGFGGGASVLVAGTALIEASHTGAETGLDFTGATVASGIVGAVTFTGSLVAWAKLQEVFNKNLHFPGLQAVNAALFLASTGMGVWVVLDPAAIHGYWILSGVAGILGVLLVAPIGGADMPVVIALLNSYSGIAAAMTGFVLNNNVLIISGSLVGASGIILSQIMCKAMNRSLLNVVFATLGPTAGTKTADEVYGGKVKASSPEEVAMLFDGARKVVIVPGYGLAVSQAQHVVRDLANLLEAKGIEVLYAIHPVAGRMPGHMNVLLAEADVPYDKMVEMDAINASFAETDVTLVIGANDVVNPVARTDPQSPIAGMPILDVDKSRTVVVIKRSLSPGFAGIPNPLFAAENCVMLFGDGKKALLELIAAVKEGG